MAQVVIVVIGSDATERSKAETMGWEVQQASKLNKQIMILNIGDYDVPSVPAVRKRCCYLSPLRSLIYFSISIGALSFIML